MDRNLSAFGSRSVAVRRDARTTGDNSVALGHGSVANQANIVSVAHRFDTANPVALTAGYSWGGGKNHGVRVGIMGEF